MHISCLMGSWQTQIRSSHPPMIWEKHLLQLHTFLTATRPDWKKYRPLSTSWAHIADGAKIQCKYWAHRGLVPKPVNFFLQFCHHARAKFFSNRIVTAWNKLPEHVVLASSTNEINRLDQYLTKWFLIPDQHPVVPNQTGCGHWIDQHLLTAHYQNLNLNLTWTWRKRWPHAGNCAKFWRKYWPHRGVCAKFCHKSWLGHSA